MDLKREDVEAYLRNNPDFARDYYLKEVAAEERNGWASDANLLSVPVPVPIDSISETLSLGELGDVGDIRDVTGDVDPDNDESGSGSEGVSGRSRSGGSASNPRRNSITSNMFRDLIQGKRKMRKVSRRSMSELQAMSEREVFMELIRDIASEMDVNILCHKILLNVSILTKSDRGSLFLVRGSKENRFLVSKLFDVTGHSSMQESLHTEENQIRVPFGKGIAGLVASTKETVNIKNVYEDPRFNKEVDKKTGYRTRSLLCMPILNYEGDVVGVAQIINKADPHIQEFTEQDEEVFRNYLTFCGIGLTNAQLFEMSVQEYRRNQMLLSLARGIFEEQQNLDGLVERIMLEAQDMLKCERCNVYLVEDRQEGDSFLYQGIYAKIHEETHEKHQQITRQDGDVFIKHLTALKDVKTEYKQRQGRQFHSPEEVMFLKAFELHCGPEGSPSNDRNNIKHHTAQHLNKSRCAFIAKEVAHSGEILNVADTITENQTGGEVTDYDGFKVRNILSLPIHSGEKRVIGVVQLMNKCNGKSFTDTDVNSVETFAIFCGLGIHNCQMYENACKLMAKQSVALEVLSYHAMAPQEETKKLVNSDIKSCEEFHLYEYDFNDLVLSDDETVQGAVRMFVEMGVEETFRVPYEVLCRWVLSVKKNYRPVTYHNWRHALNVAQTMFTMLYTGNMKEVLSEVERFALVVACLCHDLDHRGTNNQFQSKAESPLAQLYSTSTMEHHHFDQCIMILNSEGNNIFMYLSSGEYRSTIKVIEHAILSTDLALYFEKKDKFKELANTQEPDWQDTKNKELLRGMMMTACDVAAIAKPWPIQHKIAHLVAGEFFEQGDLERDKLKQEPIPMMDRKKKDELPKMQVGFIDFICLPVYQLLAKCFPGLTPLVNGCQRNKNKWQEIADSYNPKNAELDGTSTSDMSEKAEKQQESAPVIHAPKVLPPIQKSSSQQEHSTIQTTQHSNEQCSKDNLQGNNGKSQTNKHSSPAKSNGFRDPVFNENYDKKSARSHFCVIL